ncbi:MAG: AAA domain-containing protein [Thermoanaerobaculia bacterium]|nr:AAA domain-containing protein [Thermoanaerobaculia bacterium]
MSVLASRPLLAARMPQLEEYFANARARGDREFLRSLLFELTHRKTARARELAAEIEGLLGQAADAAPSEPKPAPAPTVAENSAAAPLPIARPTPPPPQPRPAKPPRPVVEALPVPPISNEPAAILDAWTALEVLSPQSFRKPEELVGGDKARIVAFDPDSPPWVRWEKPREKYRLYYQVLLGTIAHDPALELLLERFTDARPDRPLGRGEAILAVVTLDDKGRLVDSPAVALSSFGWGLPRALAGDLRGLSGWRETERDLVERLEEFLGGPWPRELDGADEDDEVEERQPLDGQTLRAAWEWLVDELGLLPELVTPSRFVLRQYQYFKNPESPDVPLLNSFFLGDLEAARALCEKKAAPPNLRRYLGPERTDRQNLLERGQVLAEAVAPEQMPAARWPGPGRHSLVLLQQAAVNLGLRELRNDGILAVNGPPGTGKTTLLRDLVAAIVTARAEVMASFEEPAAAFTHAGQKRKAGKGWLHFYRIDPRLSGFEIVVASSNNKAVENVSEALPARHAVAGDAPELRYLKALSDALLETDTWGLVAAVLGNMANRYAFRQTFWWDEEVGLATYLSAAAGDPRRVEVRDPSGKVTEARPPRIVSEENPPTGLDAALVRWKLARTTFARVLDRSRAGLALIAEIRREAERLPTLRVDLEAAESRRQELEGIHEGALTDLSAHGERLAKLREEIAAVERTLGEIDRFAPGFLARLFRTRKAREWRVGRAPVDAARGATRQALVAELGREPELEARRRTTQAALKQGLYARDRAAKSLKEVEEPVESLRRRIGAGFVDDEFFRLDHNTRHTAVPWLDQAQQRLRDDVFVAAMAVHRAFLDAAAKPLKNNLGLLMDAFGGRGFPTAEQQALLPELWRSLFLVVPLVSTTFASVERMFGDLPAETFGWLFVDEAGQAVPQAAVGALFRAKRAVVVGDPVQIEPVVTLPDGLTSALCRHFGVDPDRFNAPVASVQTLADAATPFMAEFHGRHGSRTVGVPLLVHRRCSEPMFGIANAVAYDHLMVQAKRPGASAIGDILGPSAWIDVRGAAAEKWCPEEGEVVLELLRRLARSGAPSDLYLVTPFVVVADNLRRLVRQAKLEDWLGDSADWAKTHIGTVHTVQGREAEAVILVLGAPASEQTGARNWAGGRPNLLNVAVTRAKERLYVVGNRELWREAGVFRELAGRLESRSL